jgi:hypothetical protein
MEKMGQWAQMVAACCTVTEKTNKAVISSATVEQRQQSMVVDEDLETKTDCALLLQILSYIDGLVATYSDACGVQVVLLKSQLDALGLDYTTSNCLSLCCIGG